MFAPCWTRTQTTRASTPRPRAKIPPMPVNSRPSGIHAQITVSTAEATRFATPMMPVERFGPITWPKRSTGIIGVANLVASAVLAVIWAWIPLGLLFTGIGGIFALGLGVLALVVWVLVQQGANIVERYRSEL